MLTLAPGAAAAVSVTTPPVPNAAGLPSGSSTATKKLSLASTTAVPVTATRPLTGSSAIRVGVSFATPTANAPPPPPPPPERRIQRPVGHDPDHPKAFSACCRGIR